MLLKDAVRRHKHKFWYVSTRFRASVVDYIVAYILPDHEWSKISKCCECRKWCQCHVSVRHDICLPPMQVYVVCIARNSTRATFLCVWYIEYIQVKKHTKNHNRLILTLVYLIPYINFQLVEHWYWSSIVTHTLWQILGIRCTNGQFF